MWIYSPLLPVAADTGLSATVGNIQVGAGSVGLRASRSLAVQGANVAVGAGSVTLAPNWLRAQVSWVEVSFARSSGPVVLTVNVGGVVVAGGAVGLVYSTSNIGLGITSADIAVAGGAVGFKRDSSLTVLPANIAISSTPVRTVAGFASARVSWVEVRFATSAPINPAYVPHASFVTRVSKGVSARRLVNAIDGRERRASIAVTVRRAA